MKSIPYEIIQELEKRLLKDPTNSKLSKKLAVYYDHFFNRIVSSSNQYVVGMSMDKNRNEFFEKIFKKYIKNSDQVLEIGSGLGALIFTLLHQGVNEITSCEGNLKNIEFVTKLLKKII